MSVAARRGLRGLFAAAALALAAVVAPGADDAEAEARRAYASVRSWRGELDAVDSRDQYDLLWHDRPRRLEEFRVAFARVPAEAWKLPADAALLGEGLALVADRAWIEGDAAGAVVTYRSLLARAPDTPAAAEVRTDLLPEALLAAGDLDAALAANEEFARTAKERDLAHAHLRIGDVLAARGALAEARQAYARASDAFPWSDVAPRRTDGSERAFRLGLDLRDALLGRPCPRILSFEGVGAARRTWADLEGVVSVLYVHGSTIGFGAADVLEDLDPFHARGEPGITVLPLWTFERAGSPDGAARATRIPSARSRWRPERSTVEKAHALPAHLALLRERLRLRIPIWITSERSLAAISDAPEQPFLLVLDAKRTVVHASAEFRGSAWTRDWQRVRVALGLARRLAAAGAKPASER